jgi:hypothetical protein
VDHAEFRIGSLFWCGGGLWRCTDVGSRVIVAIRIDAAEMGGPVATELKVRFSRAGSGRRSGRGYSTTDLRICIGHRSPELPAVLGRVQSECQALPSA